MMSYLLFLLLVVVVVVGGGVMVVRGINIVILSHFWKKRTTTKPYSIFEPHPTFCICESKVTAKLISAFVFAT